MAIYVSLTLKLAFQLRVADYLIRERLLICQYSILLKVWETNDEGLGLNVRLEFSVMCSIPSFV